MFCQRDPLSGIWSEGKDIEDSGFFNSELLE